MNLLLIASTLAALQVERATAPSFRGEGDGRLVVLDAYGLTGEARRKAGFFLLEDGRLFSKAAPSRHRPGGGGEVAVRSELSLRSFPPGEYVLRARITDEVTGEVAERESPFTVRGR